MGVVESAHDMTTGGAAPTASCLRWLGYPYELAARVRVRLYEHGWFHVYRLPRPVLSVGNLTVGGTGKTPVVIFLVEQLLAQGKRVAVLSRGYRRRSQAAHLLVSDGRRVLVGPEDAGDEPHLIAMRCPGAVVAVGADRVTLGQWVLARAAVDCFVLDDGFQHLRLHRDVNLLLLDATDLHGIGAALPVGRLREPLSAARRASAIVVTRAATERDAEPVWKAVVQACGALPPPIRVAFRAEDFRRVGGDAVRPLGSFEGRAVLLFSGVGNASSFHGLARGLGLNVRDTVVFPDHVRYSPSVVETLHQRARQAGADLMVTTEKDAGKVAPFLSADDECWAVRLRTDVVAGQDRLAQVLRVTQSAAVQEGRA